jgi:hypothetical protein
LHDLPRKITVTEVKRNGARGAFEPFHMEKSVGKNTIMPRRLGNRVKASSFFFFFLLLNVKE